MLRGLSAVLLALLIWLPVPTAAQTKVTKLIVAFPPGGPVDFVARILSDPLTKELGHSVIVENKPGGNTFIAAEYVARSPADGSVLFLSSMTTVVLNQLLYSQLPYSVANDFAPVSLVVSSPTILVVHPSNPAKDARDLVAATKAAAQPFPVGSAGTGSTTHIALELFVEASGAKTLHVPYKGAAPAIADVINNQVGGFFGDLPGLIGHINGGKVKPLGVASYNGHSLLPNVKTLKEQGMDVDMNNWYAILVPAKTPPALIAGLNKTLHAVLSDANVKSRLIGSGADIIPSTPEEVTRKIDSDVKRFGNIIKARNIKIE